METIQRTPTANNKYFPTRVFFFFFFLPSQCGVLFEPGSMEVGCNNYNMVCFALQFGTSFLIETKKSKSFLPRKMRLFKTRDANFKEPRARLLIKDCVFNWFSFPKSPYDYKLTKFGILLIKGLIKFDRR